MCRARKACDCDSVDDKALLLLGLWLRMDRVARGLDSTVLRVGTLSRMSCCHQTSASHQSERAVVCRAFAKARGPRRHAGNRRESRLPKHARVSFSSSHNINTPLPSTALPPSPSTTHTPSSPLFFPPRQPTLHALPHISFTAHSYHQTNDIANMHSHVVATAIGLIASLAAAQDGTSAHLFLLH